MQSECIAEGVWRLALPSSTMPPFDHTNSYLISNAGEAVLVDMGSADRASIDIITELLVELEVKLKAVWLTHSHSDHCAGVAMLQQQWPELSVWGHAFELARRPEIRHQRAWDEAERWQLGTLTVIPIFTPGHSPGHLSFFLPERDLVLVGDMVASHGSVWVGVPEGDVSLYLQSLAKLEALAVSLLAPGHGGLIDQPASRLQAVRDHRLAREQEIVQALAKVSDVPSLCQQIYPDIDDRLLQLAESTIEAHLLRLLELHKVRKHEGRYFLC